MGSRRKVKRRKKKLKQPNTRETTTALIALRAKQAGFSLEDLALVSFGFMNEIMTESENDSYDYPVEGTAQDLVHMMGGA